MPRRPEELVPGLGRGFIGRGLREDPFASGSLSGLRKAVRVDLKAFADLQKAAQGDPIGGNEGEDEKRHPGSPFGSDTELRWNRAWAGGLGPARRVLPCRSTSIAAISVRKYSRSCGCPTMARRAFRLVPGAVPWTRRESCPGRERCKERGAGLLPAEADPPVFPEPGSKGPAVGRPGRGCFRIRGSHSILTFRSWIHGKGGPSCHLATNGGGKAGHCHPFRRARGQAGHDPDSFTPLFSS